MNIFTISIALIFTLAIVLFLIVRSWRTTPHGTLGLAETLLLKFIFKPENRFNIPAEDQRKLAKAFYKKYPEPAVEVAKVSNSTIPSPTGDIPVRVYYPSTAEKLPALVWFHGGGWVFGDLDTADDNCKNLAKGAGIIVVSVDYRLAPEHKYPAAMDDAYLATDWVKKHGAEIGIDTNNIAVGGDSAGGNLAAAVCLRARAEKGPNIDFQLLVYPVTDASNFDRASEQNFKEGYLLSVQDMDYFRTAYANSASDYSLPYFSPLLAEDHSQLPPAFVITAGFDPLKSEGKAYANKLDAAGTKVTYKNYDGTIHAFFGKSKFTQGPIAMSDAVDQLKKYLFN